MPGRRRARRPLSRRSLDPGPQPRLRRTRGTPASPWPNSCSPSPRNSAVCSCPARFRMRDRRRRAGAVTASPREAVRSASASVAIVTESTAVPRWAVRGPGIRPGSEVRGALQRRGRRGARLRMTTRSVAESHVVHAVGPWRLVAAGGRARQEARARGLLPDCGRAACPHGTPPGPAGGPGARVRRRRRPPRRSPGAQARPVGERGTRASSPPWLTAATATGRPARRESDPDGVHEVLDGVLKVGRRAVRERDDADGRRSRSKARAYTCEPSEPVPGAKKDRRGAASADRSMARDGRGQRRPLDRQARLARRGRGRRQGRRRAAPRAPRRPGRAGRPRSVIGSSRAQPCPARRGADRASATPGPARAG